MSRKVLTILLSVIALIVLTTSAIGADTNKALEEANKKVDETILLVKKGEIEKSKTSFETFKKAWRDFEDGVKDQSKQAYGDIEDKMGMVQFVYVQTPVKVDKLMAALDDLKKTNQDFLDGKYTAKTATKSANKNVQVKDLLVLLAEAKGDIQQDKTNEALEVMKKFTSYWLEVEGVILTKSQKIYNDAEKDMVTVKGYLTSNPPNKEKAIKTIERMDGYLSQVAGDDSYTVVDVMTIILREGLEALLVVIALLGFLKKSGQEDKKFWIYGGVGIGMLVSVILAVAVKLLFTSGTFGKNNFLIGGWTGVFAAIMLVYVSYWLHSKSNANEWQNYIHNQGTKALATGSLFSLGLLAFLAVFREGTETVLFYIGMASSVSLPILLSGIALGGGILILAAFLMLKVGLKIPMRPFFLVSSLLVFYLGLKFTGLGINSLQNASLIPATSSEALPTIPWLAVYPSWESVGPQIILVVAALIMFIKDNINTKKIQEDVRNEKI